MENPVEVFTYFFCGTVGLFLLFMYAGSRNSKDK